MNFLCWYCRGSADAGFPGLIKDLKMEFMFSFVCLLKTHIYGSHADKVVQRLGFDRVFRRDGSGWSRGIWGIPIFGQLIFSPLLLSQFVW